MRREAWMLAVGLVLLVFIAVGAGRFWLLQHPPPISVAEPDPNCDLQRAACTTRFPDGSTVRFQIKPRPIVILSPLQLDVAIEGFDAGVVEVDFAGVEMNMGFNRVALTVTENGDYRGQAMLPICARTRMLWEARVLIHTPNGLLAAPFQFETTR